MRRLYDYKYKQSGLTLLVDNEEFVESDKTIYTVSDGRRSVISVRLLGIRDTKDNSYTSIYSIRQQSRPSNKIFNESPTTNSYRISNFNREAGYRLYSFRRGLHE